MPHPFCAQTDLGSDLRSCSVSNAVEEVIVEGGRLWEEREKGEGNKERGKGEEREKGEERGSKREGNKERGKEEEREKGEERGSKREGGRETVEEKMSIDIMLKPASLALQVLVPGGRTWPDLRQRHR